MSDTFMINELFFNEEKFSLIFTHLYQKKTDSILFAVISIRSDIVFAVFRLTQFNQNPDKSHHQAADQAIQYLYVTKDKALRYEDDNDACSFICASDASFADNLLN